MASTIKFTILAEGLNEARRMLKPPEQLYAEPWREAMERIADIGYRSAGAAAPIGLSGQTKAKMERRVQKKPVPLWVVIKTTARRRASGTKGLPHTKPNPFPYPRLLEFSPYAQNRYRKGRNVHRFWFTNALKRVAEQMGAALEVAGREIEQRWKA